MVPKEIKNERMKVLKYFYNGYLDELSDHGDTNKKHVLLDAFDILEEHWGAFGDKEERPWR